MAARDHEADARQGIRLGIENAENVMARCVAGGCPASIFTPQRLPVIREWEYAEGHVIVFSTLDSCLGAIQIASDNTIRGAHFSMFASDMQYDTANFAMAMAAAGFVPGRNIYYFGGGVPDWQAGLGHTSFSNFGAPRPFKDYEQKAWVFEMKDGRFSYISMDLKHGLKADRWWFRPNRYLGLGR